MTNEQAKSELMQIYGMLSEEKKQALDVLMAQADGEYISRKALLEDLYKRDYTKFTHRDFVALVQYQDIVAIPSAEPCEDAISRQAVNILVDELARAISDERCCISRGRSTATIMQNILDLPPVTPQPKTAHWIVHPKGIYAHLICDNCLSNAPYDCRTNYCPNCGFRMVEPQEISDHNLKMWHDIYEEEKRRTEGSDKE